MTLTTLRRACYWLARRLGDVQAVRRGRVGRRIANLLIGRIVGRAARALWR